MAFVTVNPPPRVLCSAWFEYKELIEGLERLVTKSEGRQLDPALPQRLEQLAAVVRRKIENGK